MTHKAITVVASTHANQKPTPAGSATADQQDGAVASAQLDTIVSQLSAVPDERDYRITDADISGAIVSIVLRCVGIVINARLAYAFYVAAVERPSAERFGFFVWTVACLLVPMVVTACLQVAL